MPNRVDQLAYIRRLKAQELGYRDGTAKEAGRYLYVSKGCISFFPILGVAVTNDSISLNVIREHSNTVVLSKYVYHNDAITQKKRNGRNEFRLYLNSGIDPNGSYFLPRDIVVLTKEHRGDEVFYKIRRFPDRARGKAFRRMEQLLQAGQVPGSHALVEISKLPFKVSISRSEASRVSVPDEVTKTLIEEPIQLEAQDIDMDPATRLMRKLSFRDAVLFFYDYKCAVSGLSIKYRMHLNLEAAHIIPKHANGSDNPSNGLSLNRDLHWAFDKGFFTINDQYKIVVHKQAFSNSLLSVLDGEAIILPQDDRVRPSKFALQWHSKNIFGLFAKPKL